MTEFVIADQVAKAAPALPPFELDLAPVALGTHWAMVSPFSDGTETWIVTDVDLHLAGEQINYLDGSSEFVRRAATLCIELGSRPPAPKPILTVGWRAGCVIFGTQAWRICGKQLDHASGWKIDLQRDPTMDWRATAADTPEAVND